MTTFHNPSLSIFFCSLSTLVSFVCDLNSFFLLIQKFFVLLLRKFDLSFFRFRDSSMVDDTRVPDTSQTRPLRFLNIVLQDSLSPLSTLPPNFPDSVYPIRPSSSPSKLFLLPLHLYYRTVQTGCSSCGLSDLSLLQTSYNIIGYTSRHSQSLLEDRICRSLSVHDLIKFGEFYL